MGKGYTLRWAVFASAHSRAVRRCVREKVLRRPAEHASPRSL
jgi:hypothetical protein